MSSTNTRVVLREYAPDGVHSPDCFAIDDSQPIPNDKTLKKGQVLVQVSALSVDPHQRLFISPPPEKPTIKSAFRYPLGQAIFGIGVGTVVASKNDAFAAGDKVRSESMPWQSYAILGEDQLIKLPASDSALSDHVGVYGMAAFTAYLGTIYAGKPKAGETIMISAASGAVGQVAVQLAKARGLRVVGMAGSDEKVEHIGSLGADAVINYKTCGDLNAAIVEAAPDGIDIYFDNVGGEILDAALLNLNPLARVVLCGSMSTYGAAQSKIRGITNLPSIIVKQVTLQCIYYLPHYGTQRETDFLQEMTRLVEQGKMQFRVDERIGLESAPQALADLFAGKNFGKLIVKV
ncbi:hypothetical protein GGH94_003632 [Coemansia aciculifera]|uniref:Enoyl reductase (ER) domain-containing protein n=1 Tax=Coemansia aciculifera TaxID=417176 RepID=A0A9W8INH9_9FUNG|nr:hypothetical protein GGH94_003632 [Coemansia aciculifera]KAJ2872916.1 hypothetical protein GGH93_003631 [Coemansia aciculifera]KAJ2878447.1 hypothetical protein H4R27_005810 [Coemansia aciculifera]